MAARKGIQNVERKQRKFVFNTLVDPGFRMLMLKNHQCTHQKKTGDDEQGESERTPVSTQELEAQIEAIADVLLFACSGPRGRA